MSIHKEIKFEDEICEQLAAGGWLYTENDATDYDRQLALFPADVLAWVQETQPDAWEVLTKNHGAAAGLPPLLMQQYGYGELSFRLLQIDVAEAFTPGFTNANAVGIELTGTLAAGGTITREIDLDGISDGPGGVADFETVTLDASFSTSLLTALSFTGIYGIDDKAGFQIDNLILEVLGNYDPVTRVPGPEPSTLTLAAFALLGLVGFGWRASRKP